MFMLVLEDEKPCCPTLSKEGSSVGSMDRSMLNRGSGMVRKLSRAGRFYVSLMVLRWMDGAWCASALSLENAKEENSKTSADFAHLLSSDVENGGKICLCVHKYL